MNIFYRVALIVLCFPVSFCAGAESAAGRWEGSIQIPGREFPVIVDLDQSGNNWTGSIIMPGLDVKGAPLVDLSVAGAAISFAIKGALGSERVGPAKFQGTLSDGEKWSGKFLQGGNTAPFVLQKTGPPQVELPRQSSAISKELEGEWKGDYEMNGYPRHVTLTLKNHESGPATAELVIVGKRTNNAPVELVVEEGGLLTLESPDSGITYEGRLEKEEAGAIKGTFTLGPFERPLLLKRTQ
jgi:hypothetical protein